MNIYDLAMRLPILLLNGWLLYRGTALLAVTLQAHPPVTALLVTTVLAKASFLILIALMFAFNFLREAPIMKTRAWLPRLAALVGATLPTMMVLMPRGEATITLNIASTLMVMLGNLLAVRALRHLGRSLSIMPEARRLVTDGPYAQVRHPLYLAEGIALLGVLLQFMTWPAAALVAAQFLLQFQRMRAEEAILARAFPEYDAYRARTWRLIPQLL